MQPPSHGTFSPAGLGAWNPPSPGVSSPSRGSGLHQKARGCQQGTHTWFKMCRLRLQKSPWISPTDSGWKGKDHLACTDKCVREEADPSHADFHLGLSAVSARPLLNPKRHCFSESSKNLAFFFPQFPYQSTFVGIVFSLLVSGCTQRFITCAGLLLLLNHKCCSFSQRPLLPPLQSLFLRADQDAIFDFFLFKTYRNSSQNNLFHF